MAEQSLRAPTPSPGRPAQLPPHTPAYIGANTARQVRGAFTQLCRELVESNPGLIRKALIRGILAKPPISARYLQLAAAYLDGRPSEHVHVTGDGSMAVRVVHVHLDAAPEASAGLRDLGAGEVIDAAVARRQELDEAT